MFTAKTAITDLVLDLDGTLLNAEKKVSLNAQLAIKELREKFGWRVWLASARMPPSIVQIADKVGKISGIVAYNGALWRGQNNGRLVAGDTTISFPACALLWEELNARVNVFVAVYSGNVWVCNSPGKWLDRELWSNKVRPIVSGNEAISLVQSCHKIMLRGAPSDLEIAESIVESIFANSVKMMRNRSNIIEITAGRTSKAVAIARLLGRSEISLTGVLAVGDGPNDLELLRAASVSVAMENACSACKAEADIVVGHHNADGFAEFAAQLLAKPLHYT